MQDLQRNLDSSVQRTLRLALAGLSSVLLLAVAMLLFGSQYQGDRLDTLQADRAAPLRALQRVGYLLNVAMPAALNESGGSPQVPEPPAAEGWREVDALWQAFLAGYLNADEAALARQATAQIDELRRQAPQHYREKLAPLNASLDKLGEAKLRAGETALLEARAANRWAWICGLALGLLGLALIALVVHLVSVRVVIPIRDSARAIAALADGQTGLSLESLRLRGEFGNVGEQLKRLQALLVERSRLLAEEQEALRMLRSAQADLIEAEKLASLGGLVAGVAHELNTPLGVAVSLASSLRDRSRHLAADVETGPLRRSQLDDFVAAVSEASTLIENNMVRAAELMRSFKQVAVDRTGMQRRRFDLGTMVGEVVASLKPAYGRNGVELINEVPSGLGLESYPGALGQVLSNLIINAVVHGLNRRNGRVRIALASAADADPLSLSVSDDGAGMSPAVQERAFEPFFSTRLGQGGSGLGLAIVRNIVISMLGGQVELQSSPGQGTCFTLELPLVAPDAAAELDLMPKVMFAHEPVALA
ncbi:sensor histidine kinase [Pelomonas sp. KK5]|uniref:sensor histidine kinase n=1 Tax=Pelomonas sp. KK5 TaxID=1855730 RepID=UPI00097C51DC|nr:HAMP domain-containing sensor histidine kinase [Pelomonas sp. KK5]